jgi:hypothetical protein
MATQADHHPVDAAIALENVPERLNGPIGFDTWNIYVDRILGTDDLESITHSSSSYGPHSLFHMESVFIKDRNIKQLDPKILEKLDILPTPRKYADEIYDSIKRIASGRGIEDIANPYFHATSMRREDYGTMKQFVNAFRLTVKQANRLPGIQIPPLAAALLLPRAKLPVWVTAIKPVIGKRNDALTETELLDPHKYVG